MFMFMTALESLNARIQCYFADVLANVCSLSSFCSLQDIFIDFSFTAISLSVIRLNF